MRSIALIGAGYISDTHAQVITENGFGQIVAVLDPSQERARALAAKWHVGRTFSALDELLAAKIASVAHVLVPPPLHYTVALPLLQAGLHVLLEKPMAATDAECRCLQEAAKAQNVALHVNQNFVYHPANRRLLRILCSGAVGQVRHVSCLYNMPLAQLDSGQSGHWMFHEPRNLLLEQAVHPFSQIDSILGPIQDIKALAQPPRQFGGSEVFDRWQFALTCERGTASMLFAVGQSFPEWSITAVCDDGAIHADYIRNTVTTRRPTKWMEFFDTTANLERQAASISVQGGHNALNYMLSTLKLRKRSDVFYQSMLGSIGAFYQGLENHAGGMSGALGRRLVQVCERIAVDAGTIVKNAPVASIPEQSQYDVLVVGGTGFIGRHVVAAFLQAGKSVAVLARNTANLPQLFHDPRVGIFRGSAQDLSALRRALSGARTVVSLAHGGGADQWPEIERAIVGGATLLAQLCLDEKVDRLIYVSSIAALDVGKPGATILDATPADPHADRRDSYSRAKAYAERELLALHASSSLPVVILRPGLVVGEAGIAFHSGIGFYHRDAHCLGWNAGTNPLPLVLVEDVANAIVQAATTPAAVGKTFNLVGDVRLTAREYTAELAHALQRPLTFHPQTIAKQQAIEIVKWLVKRAIGRAAPFPNIDDLKSRGLVSPFDTSETKRVLGWKPVAERETFIQRGVAVYAE
jgi:predicted dehydrogenase/nucleoside-diphosphate-sugar epimerase